MESTFTKLINHYDSYEIKNFQVIHHDKSQKSDFLNQEHSLALNLNSISVKEGIEVIKSNENLKEDFFKFELYKRKGGIFREELIEEIFKTLRCAYYIEDVIKFVLENSNFSLIVDIIILNSKYLLENQLALLLKIILSIEAGTKFKKFKHSHFEDFLKKTKLAFTLTNFKVFLVYILTVDMKGLYDKNLLVKSILIEFASEKIQIEDDNEDSTDFESKEYEVKKIVDLLYITYNIVKLTKENNSLEFLNVILNILIFFEFNQLVEKSLLVDIFDTIRTDDDINNMISKLKIELNSFYKVKCLVNNFDNLTKGMDYLENNLTHKYVIDDVLEI